MFRIQLSHCPGGKLKILLSAFACEPDRGSECEVGWRWALCLTGMGHDVAVLTRSVSRPAIERAIAKLPAVRSKPRFTYFDVSPALRWETRGSLHLHHLIWQRKAAQFAQGLNAQEHFEWVHHVTYAGLRAPSFMGRLGIPFIFGPVGGGESAPWRLRRGYSIRGLVADAFRDAANSLVRLEPTMRKTFAHATKVYVTSDQTLNVLPRRYRQKAAIELAIGIDGVPAVGWPIETWPEPRMKGPRVLYAGRFIDCKGMHLGLPAFAKLLESHPDAKLTMVGEGPAKDRWQQLSRRLKVSTSIIWLPWQRKEDMAAIYADHDVLLCPALHDPGCFVVLEALSHGLPVVCLRLGGPGVMVTDACGIPVDVGSKSRVEVIGALGRALSKLADPETHARMASAAHERCSAFGWQKKVERIYGLPS